MKLNRQSTGDARGAVFVEKLIVYLPLLLTFFVAWELAEVTAAHLVVQRASAAAGRAAMVVLPDDPLYYDGEPEHSFDGRRREDIELAAGMVLSAIPQLSSEFSVEVSDPPTAFGSIDVTVTAPYECGALALVCGDDGTLELTSTTTHAYHGARYAYGAGGSGLGGSSAALTSTNSTQLGSQSQAVKQGKGNDGNGKGKGKADPDSDSEDDSCSYDGSCSDEDTIDPGEGPSKPPQHIGTKRKKPTKWGDDSDDMTREALKHRCENGTGLGLNVAVIKYRCAGETFYITAESKKGKNHHSEQEVWDAYKKKDPKGKCVVEEFYTEREPCDFNCIPWFDTNPDAQKHNLKDKVTWDFDYNPKFDPKNDPTSDSKYNAHREACKRIKKNYGSKGFFNSCGIKRWNKTKNGGKGSPDYTKCLEYLQATEEAAKNGPRQKGNKDHDKAVKDAMKKKCPGVKPGKKPGSGGSGKSKQQLEEEAQALEDEADALDDEADALRAEANGLPDGDPRKAQLRKEANNAKNRARVRRKKAKGMRDEANATEEPDPDAMDTSE